MTGGANGPSGPKERKMKTEKYVMPNAQKEVVRGMSSQELSDFQLRLQINCELTHQESADYINQAFTDIPVDFNN